MVSREVQCSGCGKEAPPAEHWPEEWFVVDADGSIVYPFGGGAYKVEENMPASSAGNAGVCSEACLEVVRKRRMRDAGKK